MSHSHIFLLNSSEYLINQIFMQFINIRFIALHIQGHVLILIAATERKVVNSIPKDADCQIYYRGEVHKGVMLILNFQMI